jgi:hypothetical protein
MLEQGIGGEYWIRIAMSFTEHFVMFVVNERM